LSRDRDPDAELRERFGALRERDAALAPAFARMTADPTPHPRRDSARPAWAGAFALAIAVGMFAAMGRHAPQSDADAVALPAWPKNTAFLLADAGDAARGLAWTASPTSGLGRSAFTRYEENR